jgi:hypothetical protein
MISLVNLLRVATATATLVGLLCTVVPAASARPIYDNLGSSRDGSDPVFGFGPLADSFATGADGAGYLSDISALLLNGSTSVVGDIRVSLHADSSNAPGAELVSLGILSSAAISTAAFSAYEFAPLTPFLLDANTMYWLEIEALAPNAIFWSWSNDLAALGVAGQFNYSATLGTQANSSLAPYQLAVNVNAIPTAGTLALMVLGLLGAAVSRSRIVA